MQTNLTRGTADTRVVSPPICIAMLLLLSYQNQDLFSSWLVFVPAY
jgi:hypothetical protein